MKCIKNVTIFDYRKFLEDAYVIFDEVILEVGKMSDFPNPDCEIIDGNHQWLIPGFLNAHCHIYSAFARGLSFPMNPQTFQDILDQLWWKIDGALDLDMVYYSGVQIARDSLLAGITTLIDHHASGEISTSLETLTQAVVDLAGLKGIFAFETSDRFDVSECINENVAFASNQKNNSSALFGAHASLSLSDETLQNIKKQKTMPLHIHVAESELDQKDSLSKSYRRVIHRLDHFGLLEKDTLLAHCVHCDDDELDIIAKRGCSIVVNVQSNMNNAVGLPNVLKMKSKGIPVLIGNDGLFPSIASEYNAIYFAMHHQSQSFTKFSLTTLQEMILDGYDYASRRLSKTIGKIDKGASADFCLFPYEAAMPLHKGNAFAHLFFGIFHDFRPKSVYTDGIQRVFDYQASESLETALKQAKKSAQRLFDDLQKEG